MISGVKSEDLDPKCVSFMLNFLLQTGTAVKDISLPFSFSTTMSSMVSKY